MICSEETCESFESKWYNRFLFAKKPSTFDFNKPINREIGRLSDHKEQKFGTTIPDDKMDMELYTYLIFHKMVSYPSRTVKLEHLSKVAQKYMNERKGSLSIYPMEYVHRYHMTIQRATDEVDSAFLLKRDTVEQDRRGGWFKFIKTRFNRQTLN